MGKKRWTWEEVSKWRAENRQMLYFNKEDANIFVPKAYGFGLTINWANPLAYVVIVAVIAVIFVIRTVIRG